MKKQTITFKTYLPFDQDLVFSWHLRQGALERLSAPNIKTRIVKRGCPDDVGSTTAIQMSLGPFHYTWMAKHVFFDPSGTFIDEAVKSPFPLFRHTHHMEKSGEGCLLTDTIEYIPPFFCSRSFTEKRLRRLFSFRHARLLQDLTVAARYSQQKKKVLISGASGFVGRELSSFLSSQGHDVTAVTRGKSTICGKTLSWDLYQDGMNLEELEGFDVMIHLAGESIAEKRWSKSQKSKIFQSRSRNTWLLSQTLSRIKRPPRTFISASAVGIYGDCMDSIVDEKSPYAHDFLADVCIHWERASECLSEKGIRRCLARFGYILSPQGGMLAKMLPSFRLFFGARLGTSEQWMPWVALDDVVYSLYHMMMREDLEGPFNITAPEPLRQGLFASCLAKALHRPLWLKVSAPILRLVLNERADALLLRSCRALPCRLVKSGYTFCFSTLDNFFSAYF